MKGIWFAIFHSISAFCNAGFDVLGTADNQFASMTTYACNPVINITLMLLIVIGLRGKILRIISIILKDIRCRAN